MHHLLKLKASGLAAELSAFTIQLIRTPSMSLAERRVGELVHETMTRLGYDRVFSDGYGNVIGVLQGRSDRPVTLLASHLDTVGEASGWTKPIFDAQVEDGRVFGIGAADCKGGLAAHVFAGALLKRSLLPLQGTVLVAATVAEENGLSLGFRHLLSRTLPELNLIPEQVILSEPTGLDICHGHDGWMDVSVRVTATDARARTNSIRRIAEELHSVGMLLDLPNPTSSENSDAGRADIFGYHPLRENEESQQVLKRLQHQLELAVRGGKGVGVSVEISEEYQPLHIGVVERVRKVVNGWSIDPYHPLVSKARGALQAADMGSAVRRWNLSLRHMGTAGSVAVTEFKIPTIGYGPGVEAQAHAPNESVALADVHSAMIGTASIAHALAGIPVFGWSTDEP